MRNRTLFTTVAGFLSLFALLSLPAYSQNRLPQAIPAGSARVPIANTVSPRAKLATDLGPAASDKALESLSLRFSMTTVQSAALDQLLANQQNPSSALYHKWLTPAQFGAEFGLSPTDLTTVSNWLQAQGFTVTGVANGGSFITFSGTVGQVNQAFGVTLHSLSLQGEQHIANLTDPVLPASLANVVGGITGLNDFRLKSRAIHRVLPANAKFNGGTGGNGYGNLMAPGDFYTIYDINPLLTAATPINGSGVTIGVMGQVDVISSDIQAFRTAAGLSTTNLPTTVVEGTDPGTPSAQECNVTNPPNACLDLSESSLDLEWAGATAPSASLLFVTGVDVFANSMTQAVDKNLAPILTVSYGECESGWGSTLVAQYNALFKQANAQGQTILGPAADSGATDCDFGVTLATQGLAVDFPASSPYVTGVGGTEFDEGSGAYWNATAGANGGTAIGYIPEQPWNETFLSGTVNGTAAPVAGLLYAGAGGGGLSQVFSKPSWQVGNGVPADASRDVPDIAFNAAANHDGYLVCVLGSCTSNTFGFTSGGVVNYDVFGGTSVSTPSFAGILALLEQKLSSKGLGNVNPNIYGLANSTYASTVFHEKTVGGTNAVPCSAGSIDCSPGYPNYYAAGGLACPANSCSGTIGYPAIGYVAGSGYVYDLTTGWGSVDVNNMVTDWLLATPTTVATTLGDASVTTASTTTPSVTAGTAVTITAAVASGSSTITTTPSGSVQLLVDGVATGATVTLANGAATFPAYATTNLVSGPHTFTASYSGDATYAGSLGAVSVNITSTTAADFSITPATASITVASGGTSSGTTYTVTSLNGFSGQVTFTASTSSTTLNNDASVSFSVDPVTVTTTTPGTTAFTLYAYFNSTTGLARKRVQLSAAQNPLPPSSSPWKLAGYGVALAGLILVALPRRRRNRWSALFVALVSVGILTATGCVSSSNSTGSSNGNINVPAGTYPVTITAQGTNAAGAVLTHNVSVTLVVQ
jgi:hypothetical protein